MHQELVQPDVICEEYDQLHDCITIQEIRRLLQLCGRYSSYWMYFVLRITTGMRPDEAVKLTLYNFSPDCKTITYRVDKPSTKLMKSQEYVQKRKHRRVVLDDWTHRQLKTYLNQTCRLVNGIYVSPYKGQKLFPWNKMGVVGAYWYKQRKKLQKEGYDSLRMIREYKRPGRVHKVYVVRPHILRHFSASVMYYKLGRDLKAVMEWIKHNDVETTNGYVHSAQSMGGTLEYFENATWAEILGYDPGQESLHDGLTTCQTSLDCY